MVSLFGKEIKLFQFYETPKKDDMGEKEKRLLRAVSYDPLTTKSSKDKLTPRRRRECALESPLLMKGIRKKSSDTFRAWFEIYKIGTQDKIPEVDMRYIIEFNKRTNFKQKLYNADVPSMVYGDGFLLITFSKEDRGVDLSSEPPKNATPWQLIELNPEFITELAYANKKFEDEGILHFHYINPNNQEDKLIHPDRIIHVPCDTLPFQKFGNSKIDLLHNILNSEKEVAVAAGKILSWFARGLLDIQVEGLEEAELKKWEEQIKQKHEVFVHDEFSKLAVQNPESIDPKPFYDYILLNIAAALNIPTHILTGIQTGRVTGSEIGFSDYYRDIHDIQEIKYTPIIERVYSMLLRSYNREWKYEIHWNPIYVDEMAEAELITKRVDAAEKAFNGSRGAGGFITKEEARAMVNNGLIDLSNSDSKMKELDSRKPNVVRQPTQAELELIERWKQHKKKELDKLEELL